MVTKEIENKLEGLDVNGNHSPSDNYVYVQSQSKGMDATISVNATEQWERELMADPKARAFPTTDASRSTLMPLHRIVLLSPLSRAPIPSKSSPNAQPQSPIPRTLTSKSL